MRRPSTTQGTLFELPKPQLEAISPNPDHVTLAAKLPPSLWLGGMSWSYRGWVGSVYGTDSSEKQLAAHGLTAYAKHPLLRFVEIDRSYYEPLPVQTLRDFADQVPDDFRFVVKAHEDCTVPKFPLHARYGKKRGQENARFLDPSYAERAVVEPVCAGLGNKLGGILFQFPPHEVGAPQRFAQHLHAFLRALPSGIPYAVELRNSELFTPEYGAALADTGVHHCHNVWTGMPPVLSQARWMPPAARRPLLVRWLMRQDDRYQEAMARFSPFDRLREEDLSNRHAIARLVAKAQLHQVPTFVLVDNKAEGSAPESIVRLARAIADELTPRA